MIERLDRYGILHILLDRSDRPVNVLDRDAFRELAKILERLRIERTGRAVLFRSDRPGSFLAGMDLEILLDMDDAYKAAEGSRFGQSVLQQVADLPVPTACAIGGSCLGGGYELALACDYRLAADDPGIRIGLPETRFGAIPGFGGTQRLPRLVGFGKALALLTAGKKLGPAQALRDGLVDEVVPGDYLVDRACALLQEKMDDPEAIPGGIRRKRSLKDRLLDRGSVRFLSIRRRMLAEAELRMRREGGDPEQYPAPFRVLEALEGAASLPLSQGLDLEAKIVGELVPGATARNLMWLFLHQSRLRRNAAAGRSGAAGNVAKAGVLGAGAMGGGIARLAADAGLQVRLMDRSWDPILASLQENRESWDREVREGWISRREMERRSTRIAPAVDLSGFCRCGVVIEAVAEELERKQKVLADLEPLMADDAVYASNTSSLPIGEIAVGASRPDRVVGLHFFNPVHRMPLVEVIAGQASSSEALARIRKFAVRLGKVPVLVRDRPGFLVNRILMFYLGEAIRLMSEGIRIDAVDRAMVQFGMPVGPFALMDATGLDTALNVARVLQAAFGKRAEGSTRILEAMIVAERYGKKRGGGFYKYRRGKRILPDPEAYHLAEAGPSRSLPPETLQERMVLAMVNEAASCLAEEVVASPAELDVAMVTGTGFPPFRGGLLRYVDSIGIAVTVDRLNRLADAHGERFRPVGLLGEMATRGQRFYGGGR